MDQKLRTRLKRMGVRWYPAGWGYRLRRDVAAGWIRRGGYLRRKISQPEFDLSGIDWRARWPISGEQAAGCGTVAKNTASSDAAATMDELLATAEKLRPARQADCAVLYVWTWCRVRAELRRQGLMDEGVAMPGTWAGLPVYTALHDQEYGDTLAKLIERGKKPFVLDEDINRFRAADPDRLQAIEAAGMMRARGC